MQLQYLTTSVKFIPKLMNLHMCFLIASTGAALPIYVFVISDVNPVQFSNSFMTHMISINNKN